jgi:peptidoglycan/xylan/chitin deacetylase (PgdA/CDA1 family)
VTRRPTLAEVSGAAAISGALFLSAAGPAWSAALLGGWLLVCAVAPFLPRLGFYLPVVSHGGTGRPAVALTFDDGPDPLSTPALLALLSRRGIRAAFFVTGRNAAAYPDLVRDMLAGGHSIGNHSFSHDAAIMFRSQARLRGEIAQTQAVLAGLNIVPLVYRPPVGITHPRLIGALKAEGLIAVTFSCRAFDCGNRRIQRLADTILRTVRGDDIIMLHDTPPPGGISVDQWIDEVRRILDGLDRKGLTVVPLADLLQQPVMRRCGEANAGERAEGEPA